MTPVVEVKNLKKYFTSNKGILHAVDDVSLRIEKGKTMGIVGESGCGKSTLGRTIIHLQEATDGQILLNGEDVTLAKGRRLARVREHMQIIFQDPYSSLDPRMMVEDLIREPMVVSKKYKSRDELHRQVKKLMDLVGIESRLASAYPHELDGGRRQRIGVARALVLNPVFIVCDEPVSALDVSIQAQILNLLMDLQEERKLTYMFITHDLSVVKHISDRIMVMYLGKRVEEAASEELFENPMHPYTKALLAAIPIPALSSQHAHRTLIQGEVTSPVNPAPGCRFAPRCKFASEQCRKADIPLREIAPGHFCACVRETGFMEKTPEDAAE